MRAQFVRTVEDLMASDNNLVMLLGDIGVFGFRHTFANHPARIYNVGICEQAMTSMAAGLSSEGFRPVLHSIAPFVVERCYEQIKIDIAYQGLSVVVVSVGASYDYAALGCTHHCPGDVALMQTIPGMHIVVPGTAQDLDGLLRTVCRGSSPAYVRLTENGHSLKVPITFGRGTKVREGRAGTVIAIGPMLERVMNAVANIDVSILYYTTLSPFDSDLLLSCFDMPKIAVVEPFYEGTMSNSIVSALNGRSASLLSIGVPRKFITTYGKAEEQDVCCGLDEASLRIRLERFFND